MTINVQERDETIAVHRTEIERLKARCKKSEEQKSEIVRFEALCKKSDEKVIEVEDELETLAAVTAAYKGKISELLHELRRVQTQAGVGQQEAERHGVWTGHNTRVRCLLPDHPS
jgi:hypothetical protein